MWKSKLLLQLVDLALLEDAPHGDVTTESIIPEKMLAQATCVARERFVFCGGPIVPIVFEVLASGQVVVEYLVDEGVEVQAGESLLRAEGPARALLTAERTVLNFLQRMSAIATETRKFVKEFEGLVVLDTRKNTPGHRLLEKHAISVGGAKSHRYSLSDMVLIKDNHIDLCGDGVQGAIKKALAVKPHYMPLEVEVRNRKELHDALQYDIDVVMLDNMSNEELVQAVEQIRKKTPPPLIEVSGGVTREDAGALARLGIDAVSTSRLCGKATTVDISMHIENVEKEE